MIEKDHNNIRKIAMDGKKIVFGFFAIIFDKRCCTYRLTFLIMPTSTFFDAHKLHDITEIQRICWHNMKNFKKCQHDQYKAYKKTQPNKNRRIYKFRNLNLAVAEQPSSRMSAEPSQIRRTVTDPTNRHRSDESSQNSRSAAVPLTPTNTLQIHGFIKRR